MMSFISIWRTLWLIAYICDAVMILNVFSSFFVVYIDHRGVAYATFQVIAKTYLRGLFVFDVLSVLPYDYFLSGYLHYDSWTLATLRLNRTLGLIRAIKFLSESSLCMHQIICLPANHARKCVLSS